MISEERILSKLEKKLSEITYSKDEFQIKMETLLASEKTFKTNIEVVMKEAQIKAESETNSKISQLKINILEQVKKSIEEIPKFNNQEIIDLKTRLDDCIKTTESLSSQMQNKVEQNQLDSKFNEANTAATKKETELESRLKKQLADAIPPKCGYDKTQIQALNIKYGQMVAQISQLKASAPNASGNLGGYNGGQQQQQLVQQPVGRGSEQLKPLKRVQPEERKG